MSTRRFLMGLCAVLSLNTLLFLSGCGGSVDSNTPEEKPATTQSLEDANKAIKEQMGGMKPPK